MLKKIAMSGLIAFSLSACTALEIVHADLMLPCLPSHGVIFKVGETEVMNDELYGKFERIIITYKERIKTQCKLAEKHNKLHGDSDD